MTGMPAWTYDAAFGKCIRENHRNCKDATKNMFHTESECRKMCPVEGSHCYNYMTLNSPLIHHLIAEEDLIILVPTVIALEEFLQSREKDLSESEIRQFVLCHTIRGEKS